MAHFGWTPIHTPDGGQRWHVFVHHRVYAVYEVGLDTGKQANSARRSGRDFVLCVLIDPTNRSAGMVGPINVVFVPISIKPLELRFEILVCLHRTHASSQY